MNSEQSPEEPKKPDSEDYALHPSLGVPKKVAWALGAGLVGIAVGGAIVGFTAAVVAPAIRDRLRRGKTSSEKP